MRSRPRSWIRFWPGRGWGGVRLRVGLPVGSPSSGFGIGVEPRLRCWRTIRRIFPGRPSWIGLRVWFRFFPGNRCVPRAGGCMGRPGWSPWWMRRCWPRLRNGCNRRRSWGGSGRSPNGRATRFGGGGSLPMAAVPVMRLPVKGAMWVPHWMVLSVSGWKGCCDPWCFRVRRLIRPTVPCGWSERMEPWWKVVWFPRRHRVWFSDGRGIPISTSPRMRSVVRFFSGPA